MLGLSDFLTNPSIIIIVLGSFLFIIGFCGCLGALLEIFFLLVIYAVLLSIVLLGQIGLVIYVFVQQDQAFGAFESLVRNAIARYFDDANLRNIIDLIQAQLLNCCGINGPNDWQSNPYFNCSSRAFQRCSVPFSCCVMEEGAVINQQCGYRALDNATTTTTMIHQTGCFLAVRSFIQSNLYVVGGVGIGLLVFQLINVMLASGLAVDVYREKKIINAQKKLKKEQKQMEEHVANL